jgi:hypothetical protein
MDFPVVHMTFCMERPTRRYASVLCQNLEQPYVGRISL